MAKFSRRVVGSFYKSKDASKPPYLKFREGVSFKEGDTLRVESKKFQLESLQAAVTAGKLSADIGEEIKERIEKMPEFVLGELVQLSGNANQQQ